MTRVRSRANEDWNDERVELRIQLHLLDERGVKAGPEHIGLLTRIKELDRLIRSDLGYQAARG